jgi:hypothetical protein
LYSDYFYELLPKAINCIVANRPGSLLRCNFSIGPIDIVEKNVKEFKYIMVFWNSPWPGNAPTMYTTEPPLPPWQELKYRNVIARTINY